MKSSRRRSRARRTGERDSSDEIGIGRRAEGGAQRSTISSGILDAPKDVMERPRMVVGIDQCRDDQVVRLRRKPARSRRS